MVADLEKSERPSTLASDESAPQQQLAAEQEDSSHFTAADWALDKSVVRRLDISVVSLCAIIYFLSFLECVLPPGNVEACEDTTRADLEPGLHSRSNM